MVKLAWATDIHLDFVSDPLLVDFGARLIASNPDGVVITGDISVASKLVYHLSALEKVVQRPIYFVLGNHDFYGGTIETIRKQMKEVSNISQYLRYLPNSPYITLSPGTALLGHDGWYDALNGNWKTSNFGMSDWVYINEFALRSKNGQDKKAIVEVAQKLAHEGVTHMHNSIKAATRYHKHIIVATHVPPFAESHIYEGKQGDDNAQPWFTSKMCGDMLLDASKAFPAVQFTVLAGHTHGKYSGKIRPNLTVLVGGAEYRMPQLQEVIDFP